VPAEEDEEEEEEEEGYESQQFTLVKSLSATENENKMPLNTS
jgi:hypothetical protein